MVNYIQDGATITVTAPYTVVSGAGVLVGALFGVAANDATSGATDLEISTEGVFDLAKAAGAVSQGDKIFWDDTAKVVTTVAAGNTYIGRAIQAQVSGDATARVMLNESGTIGVFQSTEQTGTGSAQSIAHGLGVVPRAVIIYPTDLSPATAGVIVVTLGTHTTANVVVTVTTSKKYIVVALA